MSRFEDQLLDGTHSLSISKSSGIAGANARLRVRACGSRPYLRPGGGSVLSVLLAKDPPPSSVSLPAGTGGIHT
jgi:hypothetical protein